MASAALKLRADSTRISTCTSAEHRRRLDGLAIKHSFSIFYVDESATSAITLFVLLENYKQAGNRRRRRYHTVYSPPTLAHTFDGIGLGSSITLTRDETARSAGVGPPWKSSTASR